ncbi:hypothetical protein L228DRAFT_284645 [Xylona heveae TC161]|uniref:SWIM-type domain-containing protein n=1 Tax=Xylona heveae (strain CBS 132557 / TC161) TaxID=1328760 RepID=A0A165F8J3_XYLHT|nr:hypothetical protein L228DRAFT_284645 [Xylona heveae TC161]KZF20700.1 hypothetical protein L228DRAFT_284645 [Xylona heveae TC161]
MTSQSTIPSPRDVLTSLFKQINQSHSNSSLNTTTSTAGAGQAAPSTTGQTYQPTPGSILLSASPAIRRIFVTLHCLFPNELLPALDLLDRRLVSRLICQQAVGPSGTSASKKVHLECQSGFTKPTATPDERYYRPSNSRENDVQMAEGETEPTAAANVAFDRTDVTSTAAHATQRLQGDNQTQARRESRMNNALPDEFEEKKKPLKDHKDEKPYIFYVRSAASLSRPGRFSRAYDGRYYEVRTKAWNCTCPAFAFAAVSSGSGPFLTTASDPALDLVSENTEATKRPHPGRRGAEESIRDGLNFGGLSLGTGQMPVCKHLLACFLVENFPLLASYVEEKEVDEAELAGWVAGWGD